MVGSGGVLALAAFAWMRTVGPWRPPQEAMRDFEAGSGRMESQLTDPLVLAGSGVQPLVLNAINDRGMRLRRYAIGFLGCSRYRPAIAELQRVARDQTEADYVRSDALDALSLIDGNVAFELARPLVNVPGVLGTTASAVTAPDHVVPCRTFMDAILGRDS